MHTLDDRGKKLPVPRFTPQKFSLGKTILSPYIYYASTRADACIANPPPSEDHRPALPWEALRFPLFIMVERAKVGYTFPAHPYK